MALFNKTKLNAGKPRSASSERPLVLLVDDEPTNVAVLRAILDEDFELLTATNGLEALNQIKALPQPGKLRIIISDQRMPIMTGTELLRHCKEIIPDAVRIIVTGYADIHAIMACINEACIYRFFCKPLDRNDILLTIRRALEAADLQAAKQQAENNARQHLQARNEALLSTNRLKDQFLATISHELRTPMHNVIGNLELIQTSTLSQGQHDWLQDALDAAHIMRSKLDQILSFTEMQSGALQPNPRDFSLPCVLDKLTEPAERACRDKGLRLHQTRSTDLPDTIRTDQDLLMQIIDNLLDNAIKFTDQGDIGITLSVVPNASSNMALQIVISDSGPGISAAQQATALESFRQLDQQHNRHHGGLGLGLAICQEALRLLDGKLQISRQDIGTQVTVTIPIDTPTAALTQTKAQAQPGTQACKPGCKVLVVDDNAVNRKVVQAMLTKLGYSSACASNGNEALALASQDNFDMILMDCQMPIMDGFEATQRLRDQAIYLSTPIIAFTANTSQQDRARAAAAGMNDMLKKPVTMSQLAECLLQWQHSTQPFTQFAERPAGFQL